MLWAVRMCGWTISRSQPGHDGKTPYERLVGKPYRAALAQFGEKVLYPIPAHLRSVKLGRKFSLGVFLGQEDRTGQVLV